MQLINVDEVCPTEFYIFISQSNLITKHNLEVSGSLSSGAFCSFLDTEFKEKYISGKAKYLPYIIDSSMDMRCINPFCLSTINNYRVEFDAEKFREINLPTYPSRLSAIFAFGDIDSCYHVMEKYKDDNWDINTIKKFKLVGNQLNRVAKVNMEHVSLARLAYKNGMMSEGEKNKLWNGYWSSVGNISMEIPTSITTREVFETGIIWEYLIDGTVKLI